MTYADKRFPNMVFARHAGSEGVEDDAMAYAEVER